MRSAVARRELESPATRATGARLRIYTDASAESGRPGVREAKCACLLISTAAGCRFTPVIPPPFLPRANDAVCALVGRLEQRRADSAGDPDGLNWDACEGLAVVRSSIDRMRRRPRRRTNQPTNESHHELAREAASAVNESITRGPTYFAGLTAVVVDGSSTDWSDELTDAVR